MNGATHAQYCRGASQDPVLEDITGEISLTSCWHGILLGDRLQQKPFLVNWGRFRTSVMLLRSYVCLCSGVHLLSDRKSGISPAGSRSKLPYSIHPSQGFIPRTPLKEYRNIPVTQIKWPPNFPFGLTQGFFCTKIPSHVLSPACWTTHTTPTIPTPHVFNNLAAKRFCRLNSQEPAHTLGVIYRCICATVLVWADWQ